MMRKNPTVATLRDGTQFAGTGNLNNQAMLASTKELGRTDSK